MPHRSVVRRWCAANFINRRTLESAVQVREQLLKTAHKLGLTATEEPAWADGAAAGAAELQPVSTELSRQLRRCLTAAFFMQVRTRYPASDIRQYGRLECMVLTLH